MIEPQANAIYEVELCSGERRHWRYLGPDAHAVVWWQDVESGREFNESGLMYAWRIVAQAMPRSSA